MVRHVNAHTNANRRMRETDPIHRLHKNRTEITEGCMGETVRHTVQ